MQNRRYTRRTFVHRAGQVAVGLAILPLAGCEENIVEPRREGINLSFLIPTDTFYVQHGGEAAVEGWPGVPTIDRDAWTLTIDGLVGSPLTLRFSDIEAVMDQSVTMLKTMRCITDTTAVPGLIGTATWTGVPLRLFLDRAGVDRSQTRRLRFFGRDGFTNNLTMDLVYGPRPDELVEPLLVYAMNGEPLTPVHGFPVRLLVHELYGYKNVKWLERIEATSSDEVFGSYQEVLGFVDDGVMRVVNKVTNPLRGQMLSAGAFTIAGYALSGFAGIARVEVAIDDDPFTEADILSLDEIVAAQPDLQRALQLRAPDRFSYPYRGVWALWRFNWMATPGEHTIRVRATDGTGTTQSNTDPDPTDGLNPIFELTVTVV